MRFASASPAAGTPSGSATWVDEVSDRVQPAVRVDDDDRDAGVAHLQDDVPGAERGVGEDDGRVEPEDRLGVEVVTVLGDQRQVLRLGELGGDVAPDELVAETELEDGARERAVDVQREDPAGVLTVTLVPWESVTVTGSFGVGVSATGSIGVSVTAVTSPSQSRTSSSGVTSESGGVTCAATAAVLGPSSDPLSEPAFADSPHDASAHATIRTTVDAAAVLPTPRMEVR